MRRILSLVIGLPLCIVVVALAVANRRMVMLSLDPFSANAPVVSVNLPLFVIIFGALILGVILGGCVAWFGQGQARRDARRARKVAPEPKAGPALPAPVRRS
ncbi:lipopolysaccharide assembly protein LapA domain-containing protein [Aquabacter sp. L1I39]|uniref:lipopolysaccharide assembly protein LapA domain-containing protein n=1 Tax=Aquabacter sp. L1I39 TaxID=2820278 RepID=UPI001FFCEE84|nr:lipopolysaccharide assembly protein LapA domain-containing protein [Aquabacter sp. L1I39]